MSKSDTFNELEENIIDRFLEKLGSITINDDAFSDIVDKYLQFLNMVDIRRHVIDDKSSKFDVNIMRSATEDNIIHKFLSELTKILLEGEQCCDLLVRYHGFLNCAAFRLDVIDHPVSNLM